MIQDHNIYGVSKTTQQQGDSCSRVVGEGYETPSHTEFLKRDSLAKSLPIDMRVVEF